MTQTKDKHRCRIQTQDGRFVGAGTDEGSWFSLEEARNKVDYNAGQRIVEHDGVKVLWEIL